MWTIVAVCTFSTLFGILCGAYLGHCWATSKSSESEWERRAIKAERACTAPEIAYDHPKLADLYAKVSHAVLDAERDVEPDRGKYLRVSRLESTIAHIVPAHRAEGIIARTGAISAAIVAEQPVRALRLCAAYVDALDSKHGPEFIEEILALFEQPADWRPVPAHRGAQLLLPF
jgi:hypothetical protein